MRYGNIVERVDRGLLINDTLAGEAGQAPALLAVLGQLGVRHGAPRLGDFVTGAHGLTPRSRHL
jgi:hypothetical protein